MAHGIGRRRVLAMMGESCRECGALIVVFGPLDLILSAHGLTLTAFLTIVVTAGVVWSVGAYLGVEYDH